MTKFLKKLLVRTFRFISYSAGRVFFDRKYLKGRWFEKSSKGWRWVWRAIVFQKILGFNRNIPWPVSHQILLSSPENISFHVDDLNNFQTIGVYYQNSRGKIHMGKGTYIAPNVGLITMNHNIDNLHEFDGAKDIWLGSNCWIGINAVLLPGVVLGRHTIVGAGSVVTKSFPSGNVVIGGNPAKVIRKLNKEPT